MFCFFHYVPFNICFRVENLNRSFVFPIHLYGVQRQHLGIRLRQDLDLRLPTFFFIFLLLKGVSPERHSGPPNCHYAPMFFP